MIYSPQTRRALRNAIGALMLPLAALGCQHTQMASSQPTTSVYETSEGAGSKVADASRTAGHDVAQASRTVGHDVAEGSRTAGHDVAQASRTVGHGVAEASRSTYAAAYNGASESGSSIVDITTNSTVRIRNSKPESLTAPIIDVDEAMQARDWPQETAIYSGGATVAGPVGFLYEPRGGQNQWRYQVIEMPLFLVNTALLPYAFAKTPPWAPVEWKGATVQPTYTAVPPLPPE